MQNNVDNTAIGRLILTVVLILGAVVLSAQGIKSGNFLVMGLVFAIPLGIYFLTHPQSMLVWLYLIEAGSLTLPGLRGKISVIHAFMAMIIGWWIASSALTKRKLYRKETSETILVLFLINVALLMSVRGFSLGALGGYEMGGSTYVVLLLVCFLYFSASRIEIERKHVLWILFGSLIFSLIPVFAELLIWFSGGGMGFITQFVDLSLSYMKSGLQTQEMGAVRWMSLGGLAGAFFTIGLVVPFRRMKGKYAIPILLVGVAIILRMFTGFRGGTFALIAQALLWSVFMSRRRLATATVLAGTILVGWVFLILAVDYMPDNMQRAVSYLPLVQVKASVGTGAQHSINWRLDIWKYCLDNIDQYLLVGRGMVVDVKDWAFLPMQAYMDPAFFFYTHSYHSGLLALLVYLGLPGLILGTLFLLSIAYEGWRGLKDFNDHGTVAYRFYFLLNIQLTYSIFSFYVIYGNLTSSISKIIMTAVLMRVLRYYARKKEPENELSSSAVGPIA